LGLRLHFITFPGRLSALPPHNLVEGLEIRPGLPIREIFRRLKRFNRSTASLSERGSRKGYVWVSFIV
jgi:hypothetical protein